MLLAFILLCISCREKDPDRNTLKHLEQIAYCSGISFEPIYTIPLKGKLIDDPTAQKELLQINQKYDDYKLIQKKGAEQDEKEQRGEKVCPFDKEEYKDLIKIIVKYPQSKSALTAKLRIGDMLINSAEIRQVAYSILEEIKRYYPNSWQAVYASLTIGTGLWYDAKDDKEKLRQVIQYYLKDIDYYKKLDNETNPEFKQRERRGWVWWTKPDPVSARILNAVAYYYDCLNEPEKSVEIAQRVIREYPDTHEADQAKMFLYDYIRGAEWWKYREEYHKKNGCYPNFHETQQWGRDYDKNHPRTKGDDQIQHQKDQENQSLPK
jgi:hypothetical protein